MTVGELRKVLKNLPDDMVVASYDVGGYLSWEFVGTIVVDCDENSDAHKAGYPEPARPYLEING